MLPWYKKEEASPSPSEGGDVPNPTYILLSFQTVCYKDIPSFGGAWGGFLSYPATGPGVSSLPSPFGEGSGVRLFFLAGLSTDTSAA